MHKLTTSRLRWVLLLGLAMIAASVVAQGTDAPTIAVTNAWARPAAEMSAVYMRITNTGHITAHLVGIHTDAGTAHLHETVIENDVSRMRPVDVVAIPAGESVTLTPGGLHIMLADLTAPLNEGEALALTLRFASGEEVTADAWVSHAPVPHTLDTDSLTKQAQAALATETYVGQIIDPPILVQDFEAPGSEPDLNRLSDTHGTWRVIFFGYMHCPDFCPLTLIDYRDTKALLGDAAGHVRFMYISVDSARDTPAAMQRYLANFDPSFIGFAPSDDTLRRIQPDYGFYYERRMDTGSQAIYTIDHSTRSYLLDPQGVLRASFAYDTAPQQIADALLWYMEHE